MEYIIKNRKPNRLFEIFEEICKIPHGSGNEEQIAAYIEGVAKKNGHFCIRDSVNNVFVRVEGTSGRENESAILLQGHTDMVCEKNSDTVHDFERDPLKLRLDGKWLRAEGTTLGADNGVAVAVMLAIIEGVLESHPPVECLFTTSEEVGLDGAKAFDYSVVKATGMINMDSEEEGIVTVSCAGGLRSDLSFKATRVAFRGKAYEIKISGLVGGHSGVEINCGRANANKLMGRILIELSKVTDVNLSYIEGGSKDNAIPRECRAIIAVADGNAALAAFEGLRDAIVGELYECDKGAMITMTETDAPELMINACGSRSVISVLGLAANGVFAMSEGIGGLVEYSRNLGVVKTSGDVVDMVFSTRSSVESRIDSSISELYSLASLTGCSVCHYSRYPGWKYEKESALRDKYVSVARECFKKEPIIMAIHAGLECGIIKSHIPNMDMISIGPEMKGIHSPDEALDLDSLERFWTLIKEMLK